MFGSPARGVYFSDQVQNDEFGNFNMTGWYFTDQTGIEKTSVCKIQNDHVTDLKFGTLIYFIILNILLKFQVDWTTRSLKMADSRQFTDRSVKYQLAT